MFKLNRFQFLMLFFLIYLYLNVQFNTDLCLCELLLKTFHFAVVVSCNEKKGMISKILYFAIKHTL